MIRKVEIRNYRYFETFSLNLDGGVNIVVGDNDTGKSTLIEAINLALTGRIAGKSLSQEFSPYIVNQSATRNYIKELNRRKRPIPTPPEVVIELFLKELDELEILRGTNNLLGEDACGIRLRGYLSNNFIEEYESFARQPDLVRLAPTEYYDVEWLGFSGNAITARSVPATASVIDASRIRLQSGTDYHLQEIIRTHLEPRERVELSRQYRSLREEFDRRDSVRAVNEKLAGEKGVISDRDFSLSLDISQRFTWENSLVAHLSDLPFSYVGKGEQNCAKTLLAIGREAKEAQVVLIEEPENHLSFSSLGRLVSKIESRCEGKQVIVATHSSFVLNKLGLDKLVLLGSGTPFRLTSLSRETSDYFKKLSGYDTLRLVLAKRAILVEGPSDELIVQRAYLNKHGRFPIEDGVDVISVRGLSFGRFLDLAVGVGIPVCVVRDNDEKSSEEVEEIYAAYAANQGVSIHVGKDASLPSLEPQIAAINDLSALNRILGKQFESHPEMADYMKDHKTAVALAIFESPESIVMPDYICDAI